MPTEADTCRTLVTPLLQSAGWDTDPHSIAEQRSITDGRIVPVGQRFIRKPPLRADYLLFFRRDFPLAVVEAKAAYRAAADGLQQARNYAERLALSFAYATNGREILEFDYFTGRTTRLTAYPTPADLWQRYQVGRSLRSPTIAEKLLTPYNHQTGKHEHYYQQIAINRTVEAILQGDRPRLLLTMATGTGKTLVAFQICWKLWNARWTRTPGKASRRPRILYLADRNILVDQPKDGIFAAFGDARAKIESAKIVHSREMYFGIYQAMAEDDRREGLFRAYPPDFFDLVIVDECHRGSARDDSSWRAILAHFAPAVQLGMTATPLCDDNRDTYGYFGAPLYTYSLRQGIDDGFLAPYRVHRVVTEWDAAGWRPSAADLDRYGRPIPDDEYQTRDFEHVVALRARTEAIARHLTAFLRGGRTSVSAASLHAGEAAGTEAGPPGHANESRALEGGPPCPPSSPGFDPFAKTIVFCVDQEHAAEMMTALANCNADLVRDFPDYVCRVTSDEGDIGRGHLSRFQDVETRTPAILTTSQLLTTGVDAPTCKNIVLARVVGSMSEFKQMIGRGTRVRDDYGKLWFNIVDYTGSATRHFADPDFDGDPVHVTESGLDAIPAESAVKESPDSSYLSDPSSSSYLTIPPAAERRKFYFDGGRVEIAAHMVYELDPDGKQLRVVRYTEYAADKVRSLCPTSPELRRQWADPEKRSELIRRLEERGIVFEELAAAAKQPEADPFDLLCHLAFNAPLRTRRERAQQLKQSRPDFFTRFGPEARQVLEELLEKYADHGDAQFLLPDVLKVPPISQHGNVNEIVSKFGGAEKLRDAVNQLQALLYAA